jgi:3-oxoadipate enol-lactonase
MAVARIGDIVIHHQRSGSRERPALVLANSLGTDFRVWDHLLPAFAERFQVVRYDKRGHGLTDLTPGPYTIARLADDLAGLLDHLRLSQAIVVGLSIGGMIAQQLVATRPELVRGLVLMDTAHKIGTAAMWQERIDAVEAGGIASIADGILERWFTAGFRQGQADALALWRNMLTRTPAAGYAACSAAIQAADLTATTAAIAVPTLCIGGDQDGATPPDLVRALSALIPGARFALIEDAGHLPCIEQPAATAAAIDGFLRENGLG